MKKAILSFVIILYALAAFSQQSSFWIQKANIPAGGSNNVTFSIGSLGYVYTGADTNNFFVYNPASNTWLPAASFPGQHRLGAAGFSTDSFGYIGGGQGADSVLCDFYRYAPIANAWSRKANYPDTTQNAFSFSINNIGYFAGGFTLAGAPHSKCYSYNPVSDTWVQKANLPVAMGNGFSAIAGTNGYCGLGRVSTSGANNDTVFQYNTLTNSWSTQASYRILNIHRGYLYAFTVNGEIFVMDPDTINASNHGVAVFNPGTNTWSSTNIYPVISYTACQTSTTPFLSLNIGNTGYFAGANSCTSTTFWQYDPTDSFVIDSYNPDTLCFGSSISVTISTNMAFNSNNYLKINLLRPNFNQLFADSVPATHGGTYNFTVPYSFNAGTSANFAVVSTSPVYSTQWSGSVYLKSSPPPTTLAASWNYCNGSSTLLLYTSATTATDVNIWTSNPSGLQDTATHISFTPTANTTIYLYSVDTTSMCSVTDSIQVNFSNVPSLNYTDSLFALCSATSFTLGGAPDANCAYVWTGSGLNSTAPNPVVSPAINSAYHVSITDTLNGCKNAGNIQVIIDTPPGQRICLVTVDSSTSRNLLVWEKVDKFALDSFHIYREISTNNYAIIASFQRDSLSEYEDSDANPAVTSYRYKITAVDTCGHESVLSPYHNTIHLEYIGSGQLQWNDYAIEDTITPVSTYSVLVDTGGTGSWQLLISVPGTQNAATDINYNLHPSARYLVQANWAYTCTPQRSSISAVFSNFALRQATGITGLTANLFELYPNPVSNQLTLQSTFVAGNNIPVIYDVTGRALTVDYSLLADKIVYNTNNLAAGVYSVKLSYNGQLAVKKFVKVR